MNTKTFNPFNLSGKLTALGIFALVAIIWAGSGMAAQGDQEQVSTLSRQGGLQVREAADEVGIIIQGGITHGQTLRFDVFLFSPPCNAAPGPENLMLTLLDSQGNVVARSPIQRNPNQRAQTVHLDFNADQFPQQLFDNRGRLELTAVLEAGHPGGINIPGPHVIAEVFDNLTGKTTTHLTGVPLLGCATGQH